MASKKTMNTVLASAVAVAAVGGAVVGLQSTDAHAIAAGKEKCYGVVKAGKNDCGNVAKTHSCAAQSTVDGDPGEWIALPAGVCEKLVGGSLVGRLADAGGAAEKAMEEGKKMMKDHGHEGHSH